MIDFNALFKVSYGLYIVSSGNKEYGNGYISNTVFQVTAEPPLFATCCNKNNHTAGLISASGVFSVSVLQCDTSADLMGKFGYKSGKDTNKFEGLNIQYGETGAPIVMNDAIAVLEFSVKQTNDLGTHLMFVAELVRAEIIDDGPEPLTYLYYRQVKKGAAPKNAPTYIDKSRLTNKENQGKTGKYKCSVCGFIYDNASEDPAFSDLPDHYTCPLCGAEKEDFIEL